jgi:predicted RNA-binding Zn-ribbon protein involved in translation (DUF1610 family)
MDIGNDYPGHNCPQCGSTIERELVLGSFA